MRYLFSFLSLFVLLRAEFQDIKINNVYVEVTSSNTVTAKDLAVNKAMNKAFTQLYQNMAPEDAWDDLSRTPLDNVRGLVKSFSHQFEKTTATSYKSNMNIVFDGEALDAFFKLRGVNALPAPTKPYLLIPIIKNNADVAIFSADNFFLTERAVQERSVVKLILPMGDFEDIQSLDAEALYQGRYDSLVEVAKRYNVNEVIIAVVDTSYPQHIELNTTIVNVEAAPWWEEQPPRTLPRTDDASTNQLTIKTVQEQAETFWKAMFVTGSSDIGENTKLEFLSTSLKDAARFDQQMATAPYISTFKLQVIQNNSRLYHAQIKTHPEKFYFALKRLGYKVEKANNVIRISVNAPTAA